jgi:hypothetical protein
VLEPTTTVEFLGLLVHLAATPRVTVPAKKRHAMISDIARILRDQENGRQVQLRALARLHGQLVHL